jgi:limonene-1,2-epoxide hydrolase
MAEVEVKGIMRDFVKVIEQGDVEKALGFLTDDVTYSIPQGSFKGKEEVKRLLTWMSQTMSGIKVTESGLGIIGAGNKAVFEHDIEGTVEGQRVKYLAMCAYEFKDGKIQHLRTVFDRLTMAQQAATGWFAKMAVNGIVKRMGKGL